MDRQTHSLVYFTDVGHQSPWSPTIQEITKKLWTLVKIECSLKMQSVLLCDGAVARNGATTLQSLSIFMHVKISYHRELRYPGVSSLLNDDPLKALWQVYVSLRGNGNKAASRIPLSLASHLITRNKTVMYHTRAFAT